MHTAIVLDINSGSVGAGVVLLRKRLPPALLYSYRKTFVIPQQEKVDLPAHGHPPAGGSGNSRSNQLSPTRSAMRRALDQVLRQTYNDGLVTLAKNNKVPRKVDHVLVTLSSIWGEDDLDLIEEEIAKVLGSKRGVCVKDFVFVLAQTLSLVDKNDVLVASVSGGATEFISTKEIGEKRSESVLVGPHAIVSALLDEFKIESHLAESLVSLYSQNVLDSEQANKIEGLVTREMDRWRELVFRNEMAQKIKKIHLFTPSSYAGISTRVFKGAYPGAEIILEERDPLELLSAFSNSLL